MGAENIPDNENAGKKPLRLLRPSIVVLCGPAGCGKSTFAERHFRATQIISSDWARGRVADEERDQRYNAQAFALVRFLIEQRLTLNRLCVVDSTALAPQHRKELLDLAKRYQVPTTLLVFNVPLETCVEHDEKRERSVGRNVVERQYQAFEQSREAVHREGFDQVVVFQDGDQEKIQIEILFRPVARQPQQGEPPESRGPRRSERSEQPPARRRDGSGGNGHSVSRAGAPPAAHRAVAPRPATIPAAAPAPTVSAPRAVEPPAPAVQTPLPTVAHAPVATSAASQPGVPPRVAAVPKPSPPAASRTVQTAPGPSNNKVGSA